MKFSRLKLFSPVASTMLLVSRRNYRFTASRLSLDPSPAKLQPVDQRLPPIDLKIVRNLDLEPE